MTEELKRPPLTIDLKKDDGETETIKLVYGLWADLQRLAPSPEVVLESLLGDPYTRDFIIRRCFTETNKSILKQEDLIDEIPVNDPEELEKLVDWVAQHLLYFFAKSARSLKEIGLAFGVKMQSLVPSLPSSDGSKDSASSTPTAGHSDAASPTSGTITTGDTPSGS